jgi:hypothetical protein
MNEIEEVKDGKVARETTAQSYSSPDTLTPQQTIFAAILAIAIGLIVTTQVDEVPEAAIAILAIPGQLWLRALRAVGKLHCARLKTVILPYQYFP